MSVRSPSASFGLVAALLLVGCASPVRPQPGTSAYAGITAADWEVIHEHNDFDGLVPLRLVAVLRSRELSRIAVLLLSGGGQHGAFGAGLLDAWPRESPDDSIPARIRFDVVTGVSTGAVQATAAFLDDPEITAKVAHFYSSVSDDDVFERKSLFGLLRRTGLASFVGLRDMLADAYPDEVIDRVGAEYARGRSLWVGTTNLDTGDFQSWNLTYIASRGTDHPDYYELYRKIVLASASIPVAIEPQYIQGEMHVDGATTRNIFAPSWMQRVAPVLGEVDQDVFIVINGKLGVRDAVIEPRFTAVAVRTLDVANAGISYQSLLGIRARTLAAVAEHDLDTKWLHSHFAYLPVDYPEPEEGVAFDQAYMQPLVEYGRRFAREGMWTTSIPEDEAP